MEKFVVTVEFDMRDGSLAVDALAEVVRWIMREFGGAHLSRALLQTEVEDV